MATVALTDLEASADQLLAPYAMRHAESGGRLHPEAAHSYRTCFQRDRDRVIHSKAFRRLGYKTQVFVNSAGDNYRTRLTHSLEVAQIARSVCIGLGLNPDFAEALALAHDLGHTPFGHSGQDVLNQLMKEHGGFEHNCQSLRQVSVLESRYLDFEGLNLSVATLKGMMKRPQIYECDRDLAPLCSARAQEQPALEAALTDHCDRIAYIHHDLEDGLDAGLLDLEGMEELEAWRTAREAVAASGGERYQRARAPLRIRSILRYMMNQAINDLMEETRSRLSELGLHDARELRALPSADYPVRYSTAMRSLLAELQRFLFARLYRSPRVMQMSRRGERIVEFLFGEFCSRPQLMPEHYQQRIASAGLQRSVADYIAGMTDRYAEQMFQNLSGPSLPGW